MNSIKHKFYSPLGKESIEKAIQEVNKERHDYLNSIPLIADDSLCIIYRETDKTIPSEEDISFHMPAQNPGMQENSEETDWFSLAREYWFITITVIIFAAYIIGKYVIK